LEADRTAGVRRCRRRYSRRVVLTGRRHRPDDVANNLTFSTAVMLPGVTLTAGTYVFEAGPGGANPNIVRVMSQNRQKLFYLGSRIRSCGSEATNPAF
jgi:hypothetical protein